jgi:hypothetical protein
MSYPQFSFPLEYDNFMLFHPGAEANASGMWSTGPGNHFEQRGLARAVSPHDSPAFSAADGEIESFVNNTRAETLGQILKGGHLFAGSRGRRNSNFTTWRFFGGSIFSILSKALIRLCTSLATAMEAQSSRLPMVTRR